MCKKKVFSKLRWYPNSNSTMLETKLILAVLMQFLYATLFESFGNLCAIMNMHVINIYIYIERIKVKEMLCTRCQRAWITRRIANLCCTILVRIKLYTHNTKACDLEGKDPRCKKYQKSRTHWRRTIRLRKGFEKNKRDAGWESEVAKFRENRSRIGKTSKSVKRLLNA